MAVQHVRRMRGGAQSHLMRAADGNLYVVKFKNNPQHLRVLANEMLATRLAERIGLPVPLTDVVEVSPWLIEHSPELNIQLAGRTLPCESGLQFGAKYVISPQDGRIYDLMPETMIGQVRNLGTFAGMLALDKWTCNANGRQATFWRKLRERKYNVTFIDQGYCFNAGEWSFPDSPLRGVYARNWVYLGVTGWESFEPWLTNIEEMALSAISECAEAIPPEWYGDWDEMSTLIDTLFKRRAIVRELVLSFKESSRNPFPNWKEN